MIAEKYYKIIQYGRIVVANLHKETKKAFSDVIADLYNIKQEHTNKPQPMIAEKYYKIIQANKEKLNAAIVYDRDFQYQYFGFKTLERSYLLKINGKTVERPQQMLMRVPLVFMAKILTKPSRPTTF